MAFDLNTAAPVASGGFDLSTARAIPTKKKVGGLAGLGRGAASLADVTIGGVLPAIAQQVVYPFARAVSTPEEAQATTARVVGAVDSPFGKAFGVTDTPEYRQQPTRELIEFIGQNFQKGAKWISKQTGIPASDVENMLGTVTVAAPGLLRKPAAAVKEAVSGAVEKATIAAKMPFEKQLAARAERQSLADYTRGPQLDAAAEAQRLGIALDPTDIQPTAGPKLTTAIAGERGKLRIEEANRVNVRRVALNELDLPPTSRLDSPQTFNAARAKLATPYEQVKQLPIQVADDAMVQRLEALRADLDIIGAKEYAPAISKIVDDAITKTDAGLTGEALLKNVKVLRERARKTYNNKSATTEALDIADTNLKVASELESMIDNSIFNPKLLGQFRDARQKMARTYAYEGATDMNTGMVDVSKLARITAKNNALTGDIASLGKIAGNFPDAFTSRASTGFMQRSLPVAGRTGITGALGYGLGHYFLGGVEGGLAGGAIGAIAGEFGRRGAANRLASPSYQKGLSLQDARIPVNQLGASMQPIPQDRALTPYQAPNPEVLMPGEGPYAPNFVFGRPDPRVTPVGAEAPINQLGYNRSPMAPVNALRAEDVRRGVMSRTLGQQAEQQSAAAAAATRQPTGGGAILEMDPVTGKLTVGAEGMRGLTPATQVIESTGKSLSGAADILAAGKAPALMTAEQRIAWNQTKADLADIVPGMKALNDKAIAAKMMDRAWVEATMIKAQDMAKAFEGIAAKAKDAQARQTALARREQMLDALDALQEQLGAARPTRSGQQGPKTRNALAPEPPRIILNNMSPDRP